MLTQLSTLTGATSTFDVAVELLAYSIIAAGIVCSTLSLSALLLGRVKSTPTGAQLVRVALSSTRHGTAINMPLGQLFSLGGVVLAFIMLIAIAASGEDDIIDTTPIAILAVTCAVLGLAMLSLGHCLVYAVTPVGGPEPSRRVVVGDVVNFGLCALRVCLC